MSESKLIHLYRGELGRMTEYRIRLDTTTNWALGMNVGVVSIALSVREVPHTVFGLALLLNVVFLWMESRRYRVFALIRDRVRLIELGFFAADFGRPVPEGWRERLGISLAEPSPVMGQVEAFSIRLRRNYVWMFVFSFVGWLFKLAHVGEIPGAAGVGGAPGWAVLLTVGVGLLVLIGLAFVHRAAEEG